MNLILFLIPFLLISCNEPDIVITNTIFCNHTLVLDGEGKIIPWYNPRENAYDHFLDMRWDFIKNRVPLSPGPDPRSRYPQYYFYCAFRNHNGIPEPDTWMNDIGEKIPNWFENARLYYAYTGESRTAPGEPSTMWGAKAYRSLNWITYCNDSLGMAFESPVSKGILSWWSDCYGECPRMFYHVFSAVPEWAPPGEDHILYSEGILRKVSYAKNSVNYFACTPGTEYLRLSFKPSNVTLNGELISRNSDLKPDAYRIENLGKGDYALVIRHRKNCEVTISK